MTWFLDPSVSQICGNWDNYLITIGRKIKVDVFSLRTDQNNVIIILLKTIQIKKIEAHLYHLVMEE